MMFSRRGTRLAKFCWWEYFVCPVGKFFSPNAIQRQPMRKARDLPGTAMRRKVCRRDTFELEGT